MVSKIERYKNTFNPNNIQIVSADGIWHAAQIICTGVTGIPDISTSALFDDVGPSAPIVIKGKSKIRHGVIIRRGTSIDEAVVEDFAVVMDYARIGKRVLVGKRALVTHSARIGDDVSIGQGAFVNSAEIGDGAVLPPGSYVLPKTIIYAGEVTPANYMIYGRGIGNRRVLSNGELDENLKPTGKGTYRKIILNPDDAFSDEHLLTETRPGFPSFHRLKGHYFSDIAELSQKEWMAMVEANCRKPGEREHLITFANWRLSYTTRQKIKQLGFMREALKIEGERVWHKTWMQSVTLLLIRYRDILEHSNIVLAQDLTLLINANLSLLNPLGGYKPVEEEQRQFDAALENSQAIISHAAKALRVHPGSVHIPAVTDLSNLAPKAKFKVSREDCMELAGRAHEILNGISIIAQSVQNQKISVTKNVVNITGDAVSRMHSLKTRLNKRNVDIMALPEGVKVHAYHSFPPDIDNESIFYGCILRGCIRIRKSVMANCDLSSEFYTVPLSAEGVVGEYITSHAAEREQHPVKLYPGLIGLGTENDRIIIHGAVLGDKSGAVPTYVSKGAYISDKTVKQGVVLADAFLPGNQSDKWQYYNNDYSGVGLQPAIDVKELPQNHPDWQSSPFKDIEPSNEPAVQARVRQVGAGKKAEIIDKFERACNYYGGSFRGSARLQVARLALIYTRETLQTAKLSAGSDDLLYLEKAITFMLSPDAEISLAEATAYEQVSKNQGLFLDRAIENMLALAEKDESVFIQSWPNGENQIGFYQAFDMLIQSADPTSLVEAGPVYETIRSQQRQGQGEEQTYRRYHPYEIAKDRLKFNIEIYPEQMRRFAKTLQELRQLLQELERWAKVEAEAAEIKREL